MVFPEPMTMPDLQWPDDAGAPPNFLTQTFIEAINRRNDVFRLDDGPFGDVFAEETKKDCIPPFAEAIASSGGRQDIAETIFSVGSLIGRDVISVLQGRH